MSREHSGGTYEVHDKKSVLTDKVAFIFNNVIDAGHAGSLFWTVEIRSLQLLRKLSWSACLKICLHLDRSNQYVTQKLRKRQSGAKIF